MLSKWDTKSIKNVSQNVNSPQQCCSGAEKAKEKGASFLKRPVNDHNNVRSDTLACQNLLVVLEVLT